MTERKTFDTSMQNGKRRGVDLDMMILKAEAITTAKTTLEHALGRDLTGWIVLTKNTDAIVYEDSRNRQNLYLKSDKNVTIDILIF